MVNVFVFHCFYRTIFQETLQDPKFDNNDSDDNDTLELLTASTLWQEGTDFEEDHGISHNS